MTTQTKTTTKTTTKTRKTPQPETTPEAMLADALRETMTPHAIALLAAKCRTCYADNELGREIEDESRWFFKVLMNMLGVDEFNRLSEEMGM